ncbi:polyprenyl diphosphate synthase [Desulfovibrio mangrovi]|uniref:polyprenyl diphosphate synthase n=1 Tax=Desulfovibrio mangrovi TaxID=2976983 RepID=UPI003B84B137
MDGNGRWAKARGLERTAGHREGTETARKIVREARSIGIRHLTLYTFSSENWARPKQEVGFLFELLVSFLKDELPSLMEQNIRLLVLGDIGALPLPARTALQHAMKKTAGNTAMTLNLALNYSGRGEIVRAVRAIMESGIAAKDITEQSISDYLYTSGQPDPDLMIRTSGELRLSNFLLYQHAYSEFHFTQTYWPDFSVDEFRSALTAYANRERRFGKTGDQIKA